MRTAARGFILYSYNNFVGIYKNMKKIVFSNVFSLVLGCICLLVCIFYPFVKVEDKNLSSNSGYKAIITVWQIDSFEGGVGSRTSFLRNVTSEYHKKNKDVLFLVVSHTVSSATLAIQQGKIPDVISYGNCGLDLAGIAKNMGTTKDTDGGVVNGKRYAYPWLKGYYFYITHKNSNKNKVDKTFVVENETYSGALALIGENTSVKNAVFMQSKECLVNFKSNKNSALVGTQRDIVRLRSQEVLFDAVPISNFCDLYQYASITTKSDSKVSYCQSFIEYLISDDVQRKLVNLKMFSVNGVSLYGEDEIFLQAEKSVVKYTLSPFMTKNQIVEIKNQAKECVLQSKGQEELIKLFKQL